MEKLCRYQTIETGCSWHSYNPLYKKVMCNHPKNFNKPCPVDVKEKQSEVEKVTVKTI